MKYYTGIGSRETPPHIMRDMVRIASTLRNHGYTLRSGGADGADSAFELGCGEQGEIWIPWDGFNGRRNSIHQTFPSKDIFLRSQEIAKAIHPVWDKLRDGARKLHSRNVLQVLGADLQTPSKFLICWAPIEDGKITGGTATAWNLAMKLGIPCYNLFVEMDRYLLECFLEELKLSI